MIERSFSNKECGLVIISLTLLNLRLFIKLSIQYRTYAEDNIARQLSETELLSKRCYLIDMKFNNHIRL